MRLTIVILIASLLQVSAATFGQKITLNQEHVQLESVLKEIRIQGGYDFFYDGKMLPKNKMVSVHVKDSNIDEVMRSVLAGLRLSYTIEGKIITLKKQADQTLMETISAVFANIDVRGRVTDAQGNPLPGVTVTVKGSSNRTTTNETGDFILRNVDDKAIIQITSIGYQTSEMPAAQNLGSIQLTTTSNALQQVDITVVNNGYQTIDKDRSAGSYARPDLEEFKNRTSTPNILRRLEGLVPGLSVNTQFINNAIPPERKAGREGLLVRGQSSLNAETTPLIVVDGIEFSGNISQINANDIEDINVLKDATSASIWGAKASNGVIVIITKKGKAGDKLRIDYDGYYAFQGRTNLDYVPRLNSQQFIALSRELFTQYYPFNQNYNTVSSFYNSLPHLQIQYDQARNKITQAQADFKLDSLAKLSNDSQINDLFVRDASSLNQTISVSGGGKSHTFYGSLNHIGTKDNTPGTHDNQYKIDLNNTFILGKRITASLTTDLTNSVTSKANTFNAAGNILPYQMYADANGNPLNVNYLGSLPNGTLFTDSLRKIYQANSRINLDYNPVLEKDRAHSTTNGLAARLVGSAKVNILKGLDFQGTYGYNISNIATREVLDQNAYAMRLQVMQFTVAANPTVTPVYNIPATGGKLTTGTSTSKEWTLRNQLLFNRDWDKHQLSIMAGQQATSNTPVTTSAVYYGWNDQLQTSRPVDLARLGNGIYGTITGNASLANNVGGREGRIARTTSYYSTIGYTFDRKYTLNGSWRIDESNLFGRDKSAQNRPVYSVGAKWALANEPFVKPITWLDRLDLRLTYGITGNAPAVGTAASYDILTAYTNPNYVTGAGFLLTSPANTKLTWEGTRVYNTGIDFGIFRNRLNGSIDAYVKKTRDLIGDLSTSPFTGYASVIGNYGNLDNKGIDIGLNSINVMGRNFFWNTGLTFSYNKNKLSLLRQNAPVTGAELASTTRLVGYPLNTLFSYSYGGLNSVGDPQFVRADGSKSAALNVATPEDIHYMGTTQPVWSGGLQNSFQYKSFGLSASIIYNGGFVVRSNLNPTFSEQVLSVNSVQLGFLDRWKVPGDESRTDIPRYAPSSAIANARNLAYYTNSEQFILNGAYAKLRDITFSYNLPGFLTKQINAQAVSFKVQLNNLLLWTANKQGMDPEFTGKTRSAQGTISLGAHITF